MKRRGVQAHLREAGAWLSRWLIDVWALAGRVMQFGATCFVIGFVCFMLGGFNSGPGQFSEATGVMVFGFILACIGIVTMLLGRRKGNSKSAKIDWTEGDGSFSPGRAYE